MARNVEDIENHGRDSGAEALFHLNELSESEREEILRLNETIAAESLNILTPAEAASILLQYSTVSFASAHPSGIHDNATAIDNIRATAAGKPANRSSYRSAPGGSVWLSGRMLRALVALARDGWRFRVTEFAGAEHSINSRHYRGTAVDIGQVGTVPVSSSHPSYRRFMQACNVYGAVELLGPGDAGHSTHIHAAWPDN